MSDGQIVGSQGAGVGLPGATTQYGTPPTNSGLWTFAALPPANSLAPGTLVYTTDEGFVYTTGVQWIPISGAGVVISPDGSINVSGLPGNQLSLTVSSEFYGAFNILPGEYSYASLPSAASYFGQIAITTNTNPFIGPVVSNGVSWLPFIFQASGVLQISTGTPAPQGTNGTAYTLTLAVTGAVGNPTWSIVGQFALSGTANTFTLNASTGVLSCADPTNNSTTAIMVQVGTATQTPVQKMITVTVAAALTPAATPTFSPVAGSYVGTQTITISSSTPSATIYYTTNNTTPTTASASIASGGTISITASCTVQAIATASGFGQSAVGSAVYTITASTTFNPIGLNIDAGGSSQLNGTMFPIFTNRIWESNVIQANASFNTPCTLTAAGWPSEDFEVALFSTGSASTQSQPSWAVGGTWFCGFIPSGGTIAIAQGNTYGNCTISNVQTGQGPGSAYTTFSLTVGSTAANPGFGFKVTGTTAGVTNLFAYLPEYATAGANTTTGYFQAVPTCTTEWVSAHNTLRRLRFMDMQNAWYNCGVLLPFTATAAAGATSATLANPFPRATGTYACTFAETGSSGLDAQNITISTSGQTAITFSATAHASTGILIPNTGTSRRTMGNFKIKTSTTGGLANSWASQTCSNEGYPLEMCMTMAIAAGVPEVHVHIPLNEDSSLSYTLSFFQALYAYSNGTGGPNGNQTFSGIYRVEFNNELWNNVAGGAGQSGSALANLLNSSFPNTETGVYQYVALRAHAVANMIRTQISSGWFNTSVALILATQGAGSGITVAQYALNYYASQGWTPKADFSHLAWSLYIEAAGLTSADSAYTIAQIQAAVSADAPTIANADDSNRLCNLALAYGLQPIGYEVGHDTNILASTGLTNLAAAMLDSGMTSINENFLQVCLDQAFGVDGLTWFKSGIFQNQGGTYFNDGLSNAYPLTSTPRWAALQSFIASYTPQFNVVTGGPGTFALSINVTTTTSSSGVYVDCNQTAGTASYPISSGLTSSVISLGNVTLQLGKNYIAIGSALAAAGITINSVNVGSSVIPGYAWLDNYPSTSLATLGTNYGSYLRSGNWYPAIFTINCT